MNNTRRNLLRLVGATLALSLAGAPAFADPSKELVDAAKAEGQMVWYTGLIVPQVVRPLAEGFQKKYGIEVKYATTGDSDTVLKLTSQARVGKMEADLFDTPGTAIAPLSAANLIEPYQPLALADYDPMFKPASKLYSGIYTLFLTTTYNTDLVPVDQAPKTYEDLLDPKWKGKMVWTDTRGVSGPPGFIGNILQTMGEEKGMDYLRKLSQQQIARDPGSQRVAIDKVISGQYEIGVMTYNHHAEISKAKGAPIAWVKMEPLVANLGAIAIVKNAPHPNAAKLFLEYLFSEDGAKIIREANYPPGHPNVQAKIPAISPKTGNFKFTLLSPEVASQEAEPLKTWLKIYDELFK